MLLRRTLVLSSGPATVCPGEEPCTPTVAVRLAAAPVPPDAPAPAVGADADAPFAAADPSAGEDGLPVPALVAAVLLVVLAAAGLTLAVARRRPAQPGGGSPIGFG